MDPKEEIRFLKGCLEDLDDATLQLQAKVLEIGDNKEANEALGRAAAGIESGKDAIRDRIISLA